ncbi:MAG: alpha-amylase, partial [Bacteroidales bacterium]|nr:alpha-amylase [Bacteroidales bacterium]
MGYDTNSDISWASYIERGFTYPNLIPFVESHDEERIMFNCLEYGNGFSGDTITSLQRNEAVAAIYLSTPGPKMLWQFEELGYDESIELCGDGTYSTDCRTPSKPLHWEYLNDYNRQKLFWTYAGMAKLKTENDVFLYGTYGQDVAGQGKRIWYSGS